jgi:Immunity protein Imm1
LGLSQPGSALFASKGKADAEGTIVFHYRGDWSEFPRWSAVQAATARQAMRDFLETTQRSSVLEWEEA